MFCQYDGHSDHILRFDVRSVRLVWGHDGNLSVRWYNFLRYTSANVDDSSVRPLKMFESAIIQHE